MDDAIVMGKITAPAGLFAALEKVRASAPVELAVLFVFSKDLRGRLFVQNNQIISGAHIDQLDEKGIKAVQKLMVVQRGMFGFRLATPEEANELHQGMSFNIDEMLAARAKALKDLPQQSHADVDDQAESTETDPAYVEWLRNEQQKVFADIENSIARAKFATQGGTYPERAQEQPQQSITQNYEPGYDPMENRWQGLDDIPTPAALTGGQTTVNNAAPPPPALSGLGQVEAEQNIKERFKQSGRFKKPEATTEIMKQSARLRAVQSDGPTGEKSTTGGAASGSSGGGLLGKVMKLFGGNKDDEKP